MSANVTRGELKNLVTDKPSPITTKLAQTMVNMEKDSVTDKQSLAQGVPVHVNPVIMRDTMGDAKLDMDIKVGPDELSLQKKAGDKTSTMALSEKKGVPVTVNPVVMRDTMGDANLGMNMRVGMDEVSVAKKAPSKATLVQLENPVYNPPWNNWSVNQPSPPHEHGLAGHEDLGQNIIVDGHAVHY